MHADAKKKPSLSSFHALGRTLFLREVEKVLQLYCTALAGIEFSIRGLEDAPAELLPRGSHLPATDGKTIYLPEKVEEQAGAEQFDYYIVLAAHQAAYIEFGSFNFDISNLSAEPDFSYYLPENADSEISLLSHFDIFFGCFRNVSLARDIFFTAEDGRVDCRLCSQYQGLARKLEKIAETALRLRCPPESLPPLEAVIECLVRLSLGEDTGYRLPERIQALWAKLVELYARVLHPEATVTDSALVTIRIYRELENFFGAQDITPTAFFEAGEAVERHPPIGMPGYQPAQPVDFRGQTDPGLVQIEAALDILQEFDEQDSSADAHPLTPEALEELIKKGAKVKIIGTNAEELTESTGLFVTDLKGIIQEKLKELTPNEKKKLSRLLQRNKSQTSTANRVFYYDEWDFIIGEYRPFWCKLQEIPMEMGAGAEVTRIKREHAALIRALRHKYQRIRPEMLKKVKRLRDGEDIVLDHVIEDVVDRKAGLSPSYRVYQNRERRKRDIATCFLLDISASTDEWVVEEPGLRDKPPSPHSQAGPFSFFSGGSHGESPEEPAPPDDAKRVIDLEREALIIVAEAIENLGDDYAIYAFSGYGRENVELFVIKEFPEPYSERIRRRIEAIEPRKSTRMGPAIRHSIMKLSQTGKKMKILILLSDGYPQDFDYGPDRSSKEYGLHDTMVALQEARRENIHTFCITIDQAGNDYLHGMCGGRDYFIVKRPSSLPHVLPRIYRKLTI